MTSINSSKLNTLVLIIISISFFIFPRLPGGLRVEDIVILSYSIILIKGFLSAKKLSPVIAIYFIFIIISFCLTLYSDIIYFDLNSIHWITFTRYVIYFLVILLGYRSAQLSSVHNKVFIITLFLLVVANVVWVFFQHFVLSSYQTLLGSKEFASYGVQLIGEGAVFQVASVLAFLILIFSLLISTTNVLFYKAILFISIITLLFFLYISESRIIILSVLISLIILTVKKMGSQKKIVVILLLMISIISLLMTPILDHFTIDNNRFTVQGVSASYLGRSEEIWAEPLKAVTNNPLKPNGIGALVDINSQTTEMHNYYLKLVYEGGLVYLFIFLSFIIVVLKTNASSEFEKFDFVMLLKLYLLVLMISAFFQDSFASNKAVYPLFFLIGYTVCNTSSKNKDI